MSDTKTIHVKQGNLQQGLSLVELMIAMTLGLFLIWGVTQSFLTSRQVYSMQQALSRIQENNRLAQEFLAFDIRNAGDYGCASGDGFLNGAADIRNDVACVAGPPIVGTTGINMISATTSFDDNFKYAVYGFDNLDANDVDGTGLINIGGALATLTPTPKAGSDILVVHIAEEIGVLNSAVGTPPTLGTAGTLTLASGASLATAIGNPLVSATMNRIAVSDCATTKVFGINADIDDGDTSIVLAGNYCTSSAFQTGASVRKLSTIYYFIADSGNGYSLFRGVSNTDITNIGAAELIAGVDDMQLEFGIDNDADGVIDVYKPANNLTGAAPATAAAWENAWNGWDWVPSAAGPPVVAAHVETTSVRAVRYSLLLRAEDDNLLPDEQPLVYNGTTLYGGNTTAGSGDRRLRQVVTSTVGIRSRVK